MKSPRQSDLVKYYFQYKDLVILHRELGFGKAPRSSEGFTESICCVLFNLLRATNIEREYDLYDPNSGAKIEVKATTDISGSTTMNPHSVFDYLYWVVFLLDQDSIIIKKIEYEDLKSFRDSAENKKRSNVTLKNFKCTHQGIFLFAKESHSLRRQSIQDQICHIKKLTA